MSMTGDKLYRILGIGKDASFEQIKDAWRRLVKLNHPDVGGDRETFDEIQHAFDVLSKPQRRLTYDNAGRDEETKLESDKNQALSMIASLLEQMISDDNPEMFLADLVQVLRDSLAKQRDQIITQMQSFAATENRIMRLKRRFKRKAKAKKGNDFIAAVFDRRLAQTKDCSKQAELVLGYTNTAITLIDDYEFETEIQTMRMPVMMRRSGFFSDAGT